MIDIDFTSKEKIEAELKRHDEAYAQLEEDLSNVKNEYTKELLKSHIVTIINNVITLKTSLEQIEKETK